MTTEQQEILDRAMAQLTLLGGEQSRALHSLSESPETAREALRQATEHANHARRALRLAGARVPALDDRPTDDKYDLGELAALSSQAGFQLLAGLNQLQELADAYDADRGKMIAGEGADFGEGIAAMRSRLRQLLGIREGGRE